MTKQYLLQISKVANSNKRLKQVSFMIGIVTLLLIFNVSYVKAVCHTSGYYNVKTDFGAVGDGVTNDTQAIKNAVDCIKNRPGNGGGTLFFPEGFYTVRNGTPSLPIDLPSGIIIVGVSGKSHGSSRIQLDSDNASIFRIGGGIGRVTIRDIALRTTALDTPPQGGNPQQIFRPGTKAIYADGPTDVSLASSNFLFSNMDFAGFERAIDVQAHDANFAWQFDQVKLDHVRFFECDNNIYINTINGGWNIIDSIMGVHKGYGSILSTGIVLEKVGGMTIQNTQGAGPAVNRITNPTGVADTFIWVKGQFSSLTLINSTSESFYNALVVDWNSYDGTIQSINSAWGDRILLRASTIFVSTGNRYHSDSVQTIPSWHAWRNAASAGGAPGTHGNAPGSNDSLIYSVGDKFDYITSDIKSCPPHTLFPPAVSTQCKRDFYLNNTPGANALVFRSGQTGTAGGDAAISDFMRPLRIGNGGCDTCYYQVERDGVSTDGTIGYLGFSGKQTGWIGFKFNGSILPEQTGTVNLGASTHKWQNIYGVNIYQGDSILVDKATGTPLYKIHEDKDFIYFDDIRTSKNLMRLDRNGNLFVAGRIIEGAKSKKTTRSKTKTIKEKGKTSSGKRRTKVKQR